MRSRQSPATVVRAVVAHLVAHGSAEHAAGVQLDTRTPNPGYVVFVTFFKPLG